MILCCKVCCNAASYAASYAVSNAASYAVSYAASYAVSNAASYAASNAASYAANHTASYAVSNAASYAVSPPHGSHTSTGHLPPLPAQPGRRREQGEEKGWCSPQGGQDAYLGHGHLRLLLLLEELLLEQLEAVLGGQRGDGGRGAGAAWAEQLLGAGRVEGAVLGVLGVKKWAG